MSMATTVRLVNLVHICPPLVIIMILVTIALLAPILIFMALVLVPFVAVEPIIKSMVLLVVLLVRLVFIVREEQIVHNVLLANIVPLALVRQLIVRQEQLHPPARMPLMIVWELLVVLVFMLMVAFVRLVQPVLINQQPVMPLLALNVRLVSIIH